MRLLYRDGSLDREISVFDTGELDGEKGRFRALQFASDAVQGAMDLDHPERIVFEYPRAMLHLMPYNNPQYEDVFVIGHGIGTIAAHAPRGRFKVAELDERVAAVSRTYFGYTQNNVTVGDGRAILEEEPPACYDYVIVDAFTPAGTPHHLTTLEFCRMVRDKLTPSGAVLLNVFGRGDNDRLTEAIHATLGETFAYTKAFMLSPSSRHRQQQSAAAYRNMILVGSDAPVRYQSRRMAGFEEFRPAPGRVLLDR